MRRTITLKTPSQKKMKKYPAATDTSSTLSDAISYNVTVQVQIFTTCRPTIQIQKHDQRCIYTTYD